MKLWSIRGNTQRLDGGAMFGNAPRAVWEKWAAPDELNRIELACRALLASPLDGKTVLSVRSSTRACVTVTACRKASTC